MARRSLAILILALVASATATAMAADPEAAPPPRLNERLLQALQHDGRVYLSNATVDGRFALRACITNFRTTRADVERVLAVVRELAG